MLDTNLKKSHKLKNLMIALVVLLPALLLVCLYPQMETAMLDKKQQWEKEWEEILEQQKTEPVIDTAIATEQPADEAASETPAEEQEIYYLQDEFVNYAIETSYYQYAMLLQEATGEEVFIDILDQYGWINDYYEMTGLVPCYAEYKHLEEQITDEGVTESVIPCTMQNDSFPLNSEEAAFLLKGEQLLDIRKTQLISSGLLGYLIVEYDAYGKLSNIQVYANDNVVYNKNIYPQAKKSIEQYKKNAEYFESDREDNLNQEKEQVCPKNFKGIYMFYKDSERFVNMENFYDPVYDENYTPYYSPEELYFATGAYWIVLALVVFVAVMALILPFFKKLETGWEKLFCIPTEVMLLVAAGGVVLGVGMCVLMSITTMTELEMLIVELGNSVELLGYKFSVSECYWALIVLSFLGWALAFFMEYICVAQIRQFFCKPVYYIKHRCLGVVAIRWLHKKLKQGVEYVLDIDINEKLHSSIIKIVLANFFVVALLCCIWLAGSLGAIVYSIVLYVLLKKYGSKLQKQYQSILKATGQMAEGDLKISLEEDLGIFEPLGEELEKVQQGFSKAVAEEAKSQNMKSELITNVSHDLKTPLTAIITYVDLLKNPEITEEERQAYIETLDLKSQRLKVLIEDLFEVSKANSGNVQMNFMDVDIVNLMKEVRVEMSDKIEASGLTFRWNLPEEKVILSLDGQRTYRVFENLLNNALKYAMPFTRVYVDVIDKESEVLITFKNMSAQELNFDAAHLTESFVRGDSSRNSEGSGLGLAIARSFTELQNGKFEVSVDGDLFKVEIRFLKNAE